MLGTGTGSVDTAIIFITTVSYKVLRTCYTDMQASLNSIPPFISDLCDIIHNNVITCVLHHSC